MVNEFLKKVTTIFKNTKDQYVRRQLCYVNLKDKQPSFCGVGECLHAVGYQCKDLEGKWTLKDFNDYDNPMHYRNMRYMLFKKFGIEFNKRYEYQSMQCHICRRENPDTLTMDHFEEVIIHGNDAHAKDFKELAQYLENQAKYYDLQTGKAILNDDSMPSTNGTNEV